MFLLKIVAAAASLLVLDAQAGQPDPGAARLAEIERASGGRLGVTLIDSAGHVRLSHRGDERFAMCSTFKLPLAAMVLDGAAGPLSGALPIARGDLLSNSPYAETRIAAGTLPVTEAAEHIVTQSDNAGANILLRRIGGPEAYTQRLRAMGDTVTRLDRYELALNENVRDDPRDTTSPTAMARTTRHLALADGLSAEGRETLRGWMVGTRTGLARIRAGLPAGWLVGDKTGTCGTAYNDVAFFRAPDGAEYVLAVYLDRPTGAAAQANAAIADVGRLAASLVQ